MMVKSSKLVRLVPASSSQVHRLLRFFHPLQSILQMKVLTQLQIHSFLFQKNLYDTHHF